MHILAVEGWPTLLAGGQERSLFDVISGLRQRGVQVSLAYEQEGDLVSEYMARGVKTFRIPTRTLVLRSVRSPGSIARFIQALWRVIVQQLKGHAGWTLIYANQCFDVTFAIVCGSILRIPVVCHLRVAPPHYLSRQLRWGLGRCAVLVCNSHFTAEAYVRAGVPKARMVVVHNGIDTNVYCPADDADLGFAAHRGERQILYVGRISPEKGIEILIKAVALARQRDPRIRLLVVGNPRGFQATESYQASLRTLARETLGAAVDFRSATPDVVALYRAADLTVLPALWEEPFGRVVIESMACGVPCLASRGGGIPEILTDELAELLFQPGDANELAARIRHFIDWRIAMPALSKACRDRVLAGFNSGKMENELFRLLHAVRGGEDRAP